MHTCVQIYIHVKFSLLCIYVYMYVYIYTYIIQYIIYKLYKYIYKLVYLAHHFILQLSNPFGVRVDREG